MAKENEYKLFWKTCGIQLRRHQQCPLFNIMTH